MKLNHFQKKPFQIILGLIIAASLGLNIYLVKEKSVFRQDEESFRVVEVLDGVECPWSGIDFCQDQLFFCALFHVIWNPGKLLQRSFPQPDAFLL